MLSKVGARTNRVVIGAILVGIVLSFLVPSTTARVACLVPIIMGIILAFGVDSKSKLRRPADDHHRAGGLDLERRHQDRIGAEHGRDRIHREDAEITVTWLDWFVAAAPWAVLMSIALYFVMMKMMPPETEEIAGRQGSHRASRSPSSAR